MKRLAGFFLIAILLGGAAATGIVLDEPGVASTVRRVHTQQVLRDRPARVLLYGDSLSSESAPHFVDAITEHQTAEVRTGVHGGTAICDWLDQMRADAAWQPDAVVIEFVGNALTPCIRDAVGDAYWAQYRADTEAILSIFSSTRVYLVATPLSRYVATRRDPNAGRLNAMYATMAQTHPRVTYVPANYSVLRSGEYTDTLPCLATEPCLGETTSTSVLRRNVVRAPDGTHFCPEPTSPAVDGVTMVCPVWASGAYRFGRAMASPVITDLEL